MHCGHYEGLLQSPWAAPVVIVPKLNGGKPVGFRICIDYRNLNSVSNFDPFPLPRMEELIESLAGAKYITKLDLTKGYFQIPLSEETKVKSAFITPYGLYQWGTLAYFMLCRWYSIWPLVSVAPS